MTREEILSMEAGREMDAAVAEAMGWSVTWHVYGNGRDSDYTYVDATDIEGHYQVICNSKWMDFEPVFNPSTDIAAAFAVLEILRTTNGVVGISTTKDHPNGEWSCFWTTVNQLLETAAPTAPLAICRAFLLATSKEGA